MKDTGEPIGPAIGVGVITCGTMFRVALAAANVESFTVIVSLRPVNVTRTVNCASALKVKSGSTHPAMGPVGLGRTDATGYGAGSRGGEIGPCYAHCASDTRRVRRECVCDLWNDTEDTCCPTLLGVHVSVSDAE